MESILEKIDTFETEELVHTAKRKYDGIKGLIENLDKVGDQLISKDTALQCLATAVQDCVTAPKMQQITNLAADYMAQYTSRLTTEEMREKLDAAGFPNLNTVIVDVDYANEAIDDGMDVFALKDGQAVLLERHNEATKYEEEGYLIAVTPFTYELEFLDDIERAIED